MTRPPDIDADTWSRARATDHDAEVVELDLPDGYRARARWYDGGSGPAVLYLHGIQSHSGWFVRSCAVLQQQGCRVLAPDRRGSGLNPAERGHAASAAQLLDDLDAWIDWLATRAGQDTVQVVAVSWGGKLATVYAARQAAPVRGLVLVAPGLCPRVDVSLREKIAIGASGVLAPRRLYDIPLTDPELFTATPHWQAFISADPLMLRQATASFFIASKHLDSLLRRVVSRLAGPVRLMLAEHDRIIDNEATIALLAPASPAVTIFPGAHHTLEFEPAPEGFLADLGCAVAPR